MEKKEKRTKRIIAGLIAIMLTFSTIVVVLFWDEISTAYKEWKANKAGWTSEENFGSIEVETGEDVEIEQPNYELDALGIQYEENTFANLGYSFLIPKDWEIASQGNRLYAMHPDFKDNFSQIEISIIPLSEFEDGISLYALRNETITLLDNSFRYHGYNDSYEIFIYNLKDATEVSSNLLYHPLDVTLRSTTMGDTLKPTFVSYYTFIDNQGYVISGVGPSTKEIAIEEITKKVASSFAKCENNYDLSTYEFSSLNEQCFLNLNIEEDIKYMVNENWELIYASNGNGMQSIGTHIYRLTNDINSPEYNMFLTVSMQPKSNSQTVESYGSFITEIYAKGNYPDDIEMYNVLNSGETTTSIKIYSEDAYAKGLKQGLLSHYAKYYVAPMSEYYYNAIQVGNYPVKNYFYSINISSKYDIVVNITHNSYNSEIAKEYMYKFISGLILE